MVKPKINGLGGCFDTELATPEHDILCLSLLKKEISNTIVSIVLNKMIWDKKAASYKSASIITGNWLNLKQEGDRWCMIRQDKFLEFCTARHFIKLKTQLEVPIKNGGYLIGVVDALITSSIRLETPYTTECTKAYWNKNPLPYSYSEKPPTNPDEIKGTSILQWYDTTTFDTNVYIEVKPKIKSFGEVLRQITIYKSYLPKDSVFAIYTNEVTQEMRDGFLSQGIQIITPEDLKNPPAILLLQIEKED